MATRFFRKRSILAKIEGTYGVDAAPTGAANAIQAQNVQITPMELEYLDRDLVRAYLGHQEQIVVTSRVRLTYDVEIAGSGIAGVAPAWGPLWRGAGFSETALAAAHAGTAQAGGASTITLAAGASAVDNAYRGMRIRLTGGTGTGQSRVGSAYVGATKVLTVSEPWTTPPDGTTVYSIDAQVAYLPVSDTFEALTKYFNMDGMRHIMLGARGTGGIQLNARSLPMFSFDFQGLMGTISDTALPTDVFTAWKKPLPVNNANTSGFSLHGFAGKLYGLDIAASNSVVYRNLVGSEDVLVTDRAPAGSVTIERPTIAEKDYFTRVKDVTLGPLSVLHGTTAGNQVHVHLPSTSLTQPRFENRESVVALQMALRAIANLGNDDIAIQAL